MREAYGDGSYGESLVDHLRRRGDDKLELSQYRFTCVVKLHHALRRLALDRSYSRFFEEAEGEWAELNRKVGEFLSVSAASLTMAVRLHDVESEAAYEELAQERREQFARSCRDIFRQLALFLARAVLRSETSEADILRRLQKIGFSPAVVPNPPHFPINSLTGLALGVFLYLVLIIPFFEQLMGMSEHQASGLTVAAKVAVVRLFTVGVTVWLMQRYAFFRRAPGEPPRFFAYAINGALCAAVAAGICLVFHLSDSDPLAASRGDAPLILLTFMLCTAVAVACDGWAADKPAPVWWHLAETFGCGLTMAVGMGIVIVYLNETLPFRVGALPEWKIALLVTMPSILAMVIGGCVPHIYRSAHSAAIARRSEEPAPDAPTPGPSAVAEPAPAGAEVVALIPNPRRPLRRARARTRAG